MDQVGAECRRLSGGRHLASLFPPSMGVSSRSGRNPAGPGASPRCRICPHPLPSSEDHSHLPSGEMTRSWHRMVVTVPSSALDALSLCLSELGTCGFEAAEEGSATRVTAYFDGETDASHLREVVVDHLHTAGLPASSCIEMGCEVERDWEREWRRFYRPVWVTDRLVVHPNWVPVEVSDDQIAIAIDPQMAFGTGGHESTQLCLQALEQVVVPGARCLDLGTGSGVLAIAATRLGAASVVALDTDPRALANARRNIAINFAGDERGDAIALIEGSSAAVAGRCFECIVANIDSSTLLPLLPELQVLLSPGGTMVLSGLLGREESACQAELASVGLEAERLRRKNEWLCLVVAAVGAAAGEGH